VAKLIAPVIPAAPLSESTATAVRKLHKEIIACLVRGAQKAYQAGKILYEAQLDCDVYKWKDWVADLGISTTTVDRYITIYMAFKDRPEAIEDKTIKEAFAEAAALFWAKSGTDARAERKAQAKYGIVNKQLLIDWEEIFAKPPVSKAKLTKYRFECPDKRSFWLIRRGINSPIKFMDLFTDVPDGDLKRPYEAMMKSIQGAMEMYYEQVEKQEPEEME
jgi:hypothetical protein